jgi:hypothetical protein
MARRGARLSVQAWLVSTFVTAGSVLYLAQPVSASHCKNLQKYGETGQDSGRIDTARGVRGLIYVNGFDTDPAKNGQVMSIRALYVRKDSTKINNVEVGWHTQDPEGSQNFVTNLAWFVDDDYHHSHFYGGASDPKKPEPDRNHLFAAKDQDGDTLWTITYDSDRDGTGEQIGPKIDLSFNRGTPWTAAEVWCEQDSAYSHFRQLESFTVQGGDWKEFASLTAGPIQNNPHYAFDPQSPTSHRFVRVDGSQRNLTDAEADLVAPPSPAPEPSPTSRGFCNHGWEPECYVPEPPPPSPSPPPPSPSPSPSPTPPPPAVLFSDGFETGDFSNWTSNTGLVAQQQERYSGSWAARGTSANGTTWAFRTLSSTYSELYLRIRFKVVSQGSSSTLNMMKLRTSSGTSLLGLYRHYNGRLGYRNDIAANATTSSTVVTTGVWHTVQIRVRVDGTAGVTETWLDGVRIGDLSRAEDFGTTPIGRIQIGENSSGRTYDVAIDDVATSTGFIG